MKTSAQRDDTDKLVVFTQNTPFETEFDGKVEGVELNGIRLKDIHDLTVEVEKQTKVVKQLVMVFGSFAIFGLGAALAMGGIILYLR